MADTILSALNELVEKQGGETKDNKLIVDAIKDLVETSGGSSGGTIIDGTVSGTLFTILKPFAEIHDEFENGGLIYVNFPTYTDGLGNTVSSNKRCLVIGTKMTMTSCYVYVAMSMADAIVPITFFAETYNVNPTYDDD